MLVCKIMHVLDSNVHYSAFFGMRQLFVEFKNRLDGLFQGLPNDDAQRRGAFV